MTTALKEIALPSGIFASIYRVTLWHKIIATHRGQEYARTHHDCPEPVALMLSFMAELVLFDGEKLTIDQVRDLDAQDTDAVVHLIHPFLYGPVRR